MVGPTDGPVCVTGASGYVATHIVERLLARGYRVRGTVRDPGRDSAVAHLKALPGAAERLELVRADLLQDGSFDAAVAGCVAVVHTASPYALDVADPQRDLVDPAVQGTRTVLASCKRAGTVKRVVVTSSGAAITDEPDGAHVLTEADWNVKSSLSRNPYYYSKVRAEREAWAYLDRERPRFDLVTINPFAVIGPAHTKALNPSVNIVRNALTGGFPVIFDLCWAIVDVRDVADAHVAAIETSAASGRYLCGAEPMCMPELVQILTDAGYGARVPRLSLTGRAGTALMHLAALFQRSGTRMYLRTHLARRFRFDHAKIRRELGVTFRPIRDSIVDTARDLERWGHLPG
jgi:dihydroflavonol-4-reductase